MKALPLLLLAGVLLTAVITDVRSHRIPNWLVFPTMLIGIGYHAYLNGSGGFLFSLKGLGLGMLLFILFYLAGGMGAGDVKLMGAVGSFLGPGDVLMAFCFTAFIGAIYAFIIIGRAGHLAALRKRYGIMLKGFFTTHELIYIPPDTAETLPVLCYGVAIALGTALSILGKHYFDLVY